MILTAIEAQSMMKCPHKVGATGNCVGDVCMVWRWITREEPTHLRQVPTSFGYCGLAGRPAHD